MRKEENLRGLADFELSQDHNRIGKIRESVSRPHSIEPAEPAPGAMLAI